MFSRRLLPSPSNPMLAGHREIGTINYLVKCYFLTLCLIVGLYQGLFSFLLFGKDPVHCQNSSDQLDTGPLDMSRCQSWSWDTGMVSS